MSTNIPSGTYVTTTNTIPQATVTQGRAIGLVGHCTNAPDTVAKYSDEEYGQIYEFTNFNDALAFLGGKIGTPTWREGSDSEAPMDGDNNLLRTIDIIYTYNPTAYIKIAVLTESLTEVDAVPDGMTNALTHLAQHSDIEWFMFCNMNPVTEGVSHANISVDPTQLVNAPRFYATGLDFNTVFNQENVVRPINDADLSAWNSFKSEQGLGLNYLGNHNYNFSKIFEDSIVVVITEGQPDADPPVEEVTEIQENITGVDVEIGGQYAVAMLVALASRNTPQYDFGANINPMGGLVYNGSQYLINTMKDSELYSIISSNWVTTIFRNNTYVFSKGTTFTSDSSWNIYQSRSITNYIHKFVVANLRPYFAFSITSTLITTIADRLSAYLSDWIGSLITSFIEPSVVVNSQSPDTLEVGLGFTPIFPLNIINLGLVVGGSS